MDIKQYIKENYPRYEIDKQCEEYIDDDMEYIRLGDLQFIGCKRIDNSLFFDYNVSFESYLRLDGYSGNDDENLTGFEEHIYHNYISKIFYSSVKLVEKVGLMPSRRMPGDCDIICV